MKKYIITREIYAVYLTDNLLSPPLHQKQLFKVGQVIEARKPTQQEISVYKVSDDKNLISSDNWIIYTNAVQNAPLTTSNISSITIGSIITSTTGKIVGGILLIALILGLLKWKKII